MTVTPYFMETGWMFALSYSESYSFYMLCWEIYHFKEMGIPSVDMLLHEAVYLWNHRPNRNLYVTPLWEQAILKALNESENYREFSIACSKRFWYEYLKQFTVVGIAGLIFYVHFAFEEHNYHMTFPQRLLPWDEQLKIINRRKAEDRKRLDVSIYGMFGFSTVVLYWCSRRFT